MTLYLDTSALVKLYAQEGGSARVKHVVSASDSVATSLVSYVETRSAFARKHRSADFDEVALRRHKREFEREWTRLHRLPVDVATIRRAGDLAERYGLKAYDAVHLSTAELFREAIRAAVHFVSFDDALNHAARRLGFMLIA